MTHLWLRAEQRPNEERTGLMPEGAAALVAAGLRVTVERSSVRAVPLEGYVAAGCAVAPENAWPQAPHDAIIFGLKELPEDGTPLVHRHIMFGHAYKGQPAGQVLLRRFRAGGGVLYDLEYLVDDAGRRVAAFGYWAGFAGAAVALKCLAAQRQGGIAGPVAKYPGRQALLDDLARDMHGLPPPTAIIIGALGRVGTGAADLCAAMGFSVTRWDTAETAHGGPFPQVLAHEVFLNCILARPGCPVFVPRSALMAPRALRVIGDIACDPTSDFSPVKVYDRATDWAAPALRVATDPVLDVTAIDNLPSLLPLESSEDYARQLLPTLLALPVLHSGVWGRARATFDHHLRDL
ncbi:MAG: saccharopine dehydrogenase [Gemmobacter sp.]